MECCFFDSTYKDSLRNLDDLNIDEDVTYV